ncbi:MAG: hypothetical protein HKM99_05305 [Flavobacteriaceae bacterium]|nr:hypothetical protein [Flavobacteriaceae bacterium]
MSANFIDYIPILTTIFSFFFLNEIVTHYRMRRTPYLLWWSIGVLTFGLGTLAESIHALIGWHSINLRVWYIVGALLGGFPLAQGSVFLLMKRGFAQISAILIVSLILVASVFIMLTPINIPEGYDNRLTGAVFSWEWVRYFSPFINLYAFLFLVGGALYSARKYYGLNDKQVHFKGNILIAIGALLPGIGGTFTRMGYVEVLFITELLGLLLIYGGYRMIKTKNKEVKLVRTVTNH